VSSFSFTRLAVAVAFGLAGGLVLVAQRRVVPLPLDVALGVRYLSSRFPIELAPEGRTVAYTMCDARRAEPARRDSFIYFLASGAPRYAAGCDIGIARIESGTMSNVTAGRGNSWAPAWSPDGKHLAFYSDRDGLARLWIWNSVTHGFRRLSAIVRPGELQAPRWMPDGARILTKILPGALSVEQANDQLVSGVREKDADGRARNSTVTVFSSASPESAEVDAQRRRALSDLALVDLKTGQIDRIARRVYASGYWISPDGANVAYTTISGYEDNRSSSVAEQELDDVIVVSTRDLKPRVVASRVRFSFGALNVSWSPDGQHLAYFTGGRLARGDCFVVSLPADGQRLITRGSHPNFTNGSRPPTWSRDGRSLYFIGGNAIWKASLEDEATSEVARIPERTLLEILPSRQGGQFASLDPERSMTVATRADATKASGFFAVDLLSGESKVLREDSRDYDGRHLMFSTSVSTDGRVVVYRSEDVQHSPELWVAADMDFGRARQVTHLNPELAAYDLGASKVIEWQTDDGRTLRGALLLPPEGAAARPYPLIVNPYPGTRSDNVHRFGLLEPGVESMQILATRGYAVWMPDVSTADGLRMKDLAATILPGIDRLVALGLADPERLGVLGHSHGGYAALALIIESDRFKAAVSRSPRIPDWPGVYGMMLKDGTNPFVSWAEVAPGRIGASLWDQRNLYLENSPLFYLDRIRTPLLLTYGGLDFGPFQADQVFVGLRRLGREVVYAKYEGEFHWEGEWGYANQVDYWHRTIAWFDGHVKSAGR
jgi:dipeptidyl aminopeptidase/acylaminoacyl peptidase